VKNIGAKAKAEDLLLFYFIDSNKTSFQRIANCLDVPQGLRQDRLPPLSPSLAKPLTIRLGKNAKAKECNGLCK